MRWRCQYVDKDSDRCTKEAVLRLQFHMDHPFDHVDVCLEHQEKYADYKWIQFLEREYMEWKNVNETEPEDNQRCDVYLDRGMACSVIVLDIVYKKPHGWLDIFDSPDAGSIISRGQAEWWREHNEADLPPEVKEEHESAVPTTTRES